MKFVIVLSIAIITSPSVCQKLIDDRNVDMPSLKTVGGNLESRSSEDQFDAILANEEESSAIRSGILDPEVADQLNGNGWLDVIPGTSGKDYPNYEVVPSTSFTCLGRTPGGYYADIEARCQVFHVCDADGEKTSFLCPNGSIFNQKYFVCDWWYDFECDDATDLYSLNEKTNRGGIGSGPSGPGRNFQGDSRDEYGKACTDEYCSGRKDDLGEDDPDLSLAGTGEGGIGYSRKNDNRGYQSAKKEEDKDHGEGNERRGNAEKVDREWRGQGERYSEKTSSISSRREKSRWSTRVNYNPEKKDVGNASDDERGQRVEKESNGRVEESVENRETKRPTNGDEFGVKFGQGRLEDERESIEDVEGVERAREERIGSEGKEGGSDGSNFGSGSDNYDREGDSSSNENNRASGEIEGNVDHSGNRKGFEEEMNSKRVNNHFDGKSTREEGSSTSYTPTGRKNSNLAGNPDHGEFSSSRHDSGSEEEELFSSKAVSRDYERTKDKGISVTAQFNSTEDSPSSQFAPGAKVKESSHSGATEEIFRRNNGQSRQRKTWGSQNGLGNGYPSAGRYGEFPDSDVIVATIAPGTVYGSREKDSWISFPKSTDSFGTRTPGKITDVLTSGGRTIASNLDVLQRSYFPSKSEDDHFTEFEIKFPSNFEKRRRGSVELSRNDDKKTSVVRQQRPRSESGNESHTRPRERESIENIVGYKPFPSISGDTNSNYPRRMRFLPLL